MLVLTTPEMTLHPLFRGVRWNRTIDPSIISAARRAGQAIGLAFDLPVHATTPGLADDTVPCDIISTFYYEDDILVDPLPIEAGSAKPPEGYGLGVELDEKKVELYREDA